MLESDVKHSQLWNEMKDRYFLKLLDTGLNNVPSSLMPIEEMSERECNEWIKECIAVTEHSSPQKKDQVYQIEVPVVNREFPLHASDYLILPLSLDDNSTLTGTASILEQFGSEFNIPCEHATRNFVFNKDEKIFDISAARKHYEFMLMLHKHRINMLNAEQYIRSGEKSIDSFDNSDCDSSEGGETEDFHAETIESTKRYFQQEDGALNKLYDRINGQMINAMQSTESGDLVKLVDKLHNTGDNWEIVTDHLGRNILHCAVENGNIPLVKTLLSAGLNINVQEGCGATPLTIAVLRKDVNMCKLLVEHFALISGVLYSNMPSPIEMAETMELTEIITIFEHDSIENEYISNIMNDVIADDHTYPTMENADGSEKDDSEIIYNRSIHIQFPTGVVGDQGTCKVTRSTKNRSQAAFKWVAEIPGDLHTKGYLCEAAYKAQKTGVFHYLVNKVMKRPKVTEEAFKSRKFQQQNLSRIQEAVRDGGMALGLAVVYNFQKSENFPSKEMLDEHFTLAGNHNQLLLQCFKDWLSTSAAKDKSFAYSIQLVDLFAPLLEALNIAVRNGLGTAREAIWKLLLPIFAQLQFRNYWTEALVHVVNFTTVWPLAFREIIKRNCSVSLSGKEGHDLAMDEFVEEHLVKPLKTYVSGNDFVCITCMCH